MLRVLSVAYPFAEVEALAAGTPVIAFRCGALAGSGACQLPRPA
jgi:hypothetical protein